MNHNRLFVAIAVVVLLAGVSFEVAAHSGSDPGVPIVATDEPGPSITSSTMATDESTTIVIPTSEPHRTTTSTTSEVHSATTTTTTEFHEPSTTIPESTTSTTAVRPAPAGPLHLECATPAPDGGPSSVVCEWNDPPPGTTRWVLMREQTGPSQPLWETTDLDVRRHVDDSAEGGVSYAYRISAYDGDTFLATSNPVRLVAGGEG